MKKVIFKKQHGFSLIETLIAVSILMIAITGPLSLVQAGLFSSNHQRNQVTATYLAQEALEFIKNLRDTNAYAYYRNGSSDWLNSPDGSLYSLCNSIADGCIIDPHDKIDGNLFVKKISNSNAVPFLMLNKNGPLIYSYDSSDDSNVTSYQRTVKITQINPDEMTVSVTMGWKDNALSRTYTVSENIYNYEQE